MENNLKTGTTEVPITIGAVNGMPVVLEEGKGGNPSVISHDGRRCGVGYASIILGPQVGDLYAAWYAANRTTVTAMQVPWFGQGQRFVIAMHDECGPRTSPARRSSVTARKQYKSAEKAVRAGQYLLSVGGGW